MSPTISLYELVPQTVQNKLQKLYQAVMDAGIDGGILTSDANDSLKLYQKELEATAEK